MRHRRTIVPASVVLLLILSGCTKNPNTVPTPAPIQVASATNALAQALDSAVPPLIAARETGKLTEQELAVAFRIMESMGGAVLKINAELRSTDSWEAQKVKILGIISSTGLPYLSAQLPPEARAILLVSITAWNSIAAAVGGPTL
jgi:hypothetical protein